MNPIEHLQGYFKKRVKERNPKNKEDLVAITIEEWYKIPHDLCKKLIMSMKTRVEQLQYAKGNHTKY